MECKSVNEKSMTTAKVKYFDEDCVFEIKTTSDLVLQELKKLSPFMEIDKNEYEVNASVLINALPISAEPEMERLVEQGQEIIVDASLYEHLSSGGKRYDKNEYEYYIKINKTTTLIYFNKKELIITIYNSDEYMLSKDTTRLLKSLISLDCEKNGAVMLHSSGVIVEEKGAVLFFGDSRNGKTTILLEALTKFDCTMLSCDTCIIKIDEKGNPKARGWPSNFSVSVGTMYDYNVLHKFVKLEKRGLSYKEAWAIHPKEVLDTKEILTNMNGSIEQESIVNEIVCLNFDPKAHTRLMEVSSEENVVNWVNKVYLGSKDPLYPNWHKFWEIDNIEIESNIKKFVQNVMDKGILIYQMDWAPGPETLLRRVNSLDSVNQNTNIIRNEA